jgi:long-chain acyl-CoA synthetase
MLIDELAGRYAGRVGPVVTGACGDVGAATILGDADVDVDAVRPGDVVAVVGGFDPVTVRRLLRLLDLPVVVVTLAPETGPQHQEYFQITGVNVVIDGAGMRRIRSEPAAHPLFGELAGRGHGGLVLFSSGTTGRPKAILHDLTRFLARYRTPRPAVRILTFLTFDHIGGVNTLLHALFNGGTIVLPSGRDPASIVGDLVRYDPDVLPATPTFLRALLLSGMVERIPPGRPRVITYGTEPMDPATLAALCERFPSTDFRQTYGMSELGILRVKSKARDSLFMRVGGDGVETRVGGDGVLRIRSAHRMLGYLNAPDPFDGEGWYDTHDLVEQDGEGFVRVLGRTDRMINVGGIKVSPDEVERAGLAHPDVLRCRASTGTNPITGQHVEVDCELRAGAAVTVAELRNHFRQRLPADRRPQRIRLAAVPVSHRFKRA